MTPTTFFSADVFFPAAGVAPLLVNRDCCWVAIGQHIGATRCTAAVAMVPTGHYSREEQQEPVVNAPPIATQSNAGPASSGAAWMSLTQQGDLAALRIHVVRLGAGQPSAPIRRTQLN